jgi:hypothetical protein
LPPDRVIVDAPPALSAAWIAALSVHWPLSVDTHEVLLLVASGASVGSLTLNVAAVAPDASAHDAVAANATVLRTPMYACRRPHTPICRTRISPGPSPW